MTVLAAQAPLRPFFIVAADASLHSFSAMCGSIALFLPRRIAIIGLLLYPQDFI